ncbi:hypothetical protein CDL15_Pgr016458 [Punica granatum]|uniref:Uncharacterized protein n=1 Tax=Punica granatum TaxID=22663 RepID=A0A218XU29_PUNGR|nr:hypothetical protein CDL15_Pgr016458 [Punica granatum]
MTSTDIATLQMRPKQIPDQSIPPADFFAIGLEHVNASRANNLGLVYDIEPTNYIRCLCGLGCTNAEGGFITKKGSKMLIKPIAKSELN